MYDCDLLFLIKTPSFFKQLIFENTSSDSNTFSTLEISWLIAPIKKLLIEIDLSESTLIVLLALLNLFHGY